MTETAAKAGARSQTRSPEPDLVVVHGPAGIDLPMLGHVPYRSAGFYGALAVVGAVGIIEWPVAAAVGVTYALARR